MAELMELVHRTGAPQVPVATRPLDDVNLVMEQLRAGSVIGRVVLTPYARCETGRRLGRGSFQFS